VVSAYRLTGEPEEVATAVAEAAVERIRRYPCDRRPAWGAANFLHDTRQTLWRDGHREQSLRLATEPLSESVVNTPAPGDRSATGELVDLFGEAVRRGRLRPSGARLILDPGPRRAHRGAGRGDRDGAAYPPEASCAGAGCTRRRGRLNI